MAIGKQSCRYIRPAGIRRQRSTGRGMQSASTRSVPPQPYPPPPSPPAPPPPPKPQQSRTKKETHLLNVASRESFQFRRDGCEVYARVHAILRHGNLQDLLTSLRRSSGKPNKRGDSFCQVMSCRVVRCDVMRRDLPILLLFVDWLPRSVSQLGCPRYCRPTPTQQVLPRKYVSWYDSTGLLCSSVG